MGFFKKIGRVAGKLVTGHIEGAVKEAGSIIGLGGSSSSGGAANTEVTAQLTYLNGIIAKLTKEYQAQNGKKPRGADLTAIRQLAQQSVNSSDGKAIISAVKTEIDAGKTSTVGTMLNGLLDKALTGIGNGLNAGLGSAVETGIGKGSEALFGAKPVKNFQEQLGNFFGGVANGAFWDWCKRNWYIAIPLAGGFIWCTVKLVQMLFGKSGKRGKSGVRTK